MAVVGCRSPWPWRSPGVIVLLFQWKVPIRAPAVSPGLGVAAVADGRGLDGFVLAIHTIVQNRYTTYAVGLACPVLHGLSTVRRTRSTGSATGRSGSATSWSDISVLELDRKALVLSRVLAVSTAVFFLAAHAGLLSPPRARRDPHPAPTQPVADASFVPRSWLPGRSIPLFAGIWLALEVSWGREGGAAKKTGKRLLAQEPGHVSRRQGPDLTHVALDLDLFPETSRYRVSGTFELVNPGDSRFARSC